MTGFGLGSASLGAGRVVAEARTVNGRFLDVRVRMPRDLSDLAAMVEMEARQRLSRGHCEIVVRLEGTVFSQPTIDRERVAAAYRALSEVCRELNPEADVPFSVLSALPDLFVPPLERDYQPLRSAVVAALGAALDDLSAMREKEGQGMAAELANRVGASKALIDGIAARSGDMLEVQARKFRERLLRVAAVMGADQKAHPDVHVDPARIEQELVLLVERSDVAEELARLRIHGEQFLTYLRGAEPLGRRLDFLLQEMAREINTIGAKSQDSGISHSVVELKAEIERMRELVQNVE